LFDKSILRNNIIKFQELGINYWAINKNASSTLTMHFGEAVGDIQKPNLAEIQLGVSFKIKDEALSRYITPNEALNNGLLNFCVIRDPCRRFISCYNHLKNPQTEVQKNTISKARFDYNWTPNDFMQYIDHTFETGQKINKHWKPQMDFLMDMSNFDHVIKQEHMIEQWPISHIIGPPKYVANKTQHAEYDYDKQKLYKLYQQDFDELGYTI